MITSIESSTTTNTGLEELWLLQSAPLQLRLVLVMTEEKSVSVCVSIRSLSSFISGSPGTDEFSEKNIPSDSHLSRDTSAFSTSIIN